MIKRLLSAVAVVAMSLGINASAATEDVLGSLNNELYDAATKTITFGAAWGWCNWWFGDKDCTEYDEFVIEFEPVDYTVQLSIQYVDADNGSAQAQAGESKCVLTLDAAAKAHVQQIAIQNAAADVTLTLKAAYFQNAVEVDPTEPVVLFEGSEDMSDNWYPGLQIDKTKIISAGAGSKLTIDYTCTGDGVSYKLSTDYTNVWLPGLENLEGYSSQYNTVYTSANPIIYTFTAEDIATLQGSSDSKFRISGGSDGFVITKVTITPAAGAEAGEATKWYISGEFQGWNHAAEGYALKTTATEGVYTIELPTLYGEFLIVWAETLGNPDWNKKICGVQNMVANNAYDYIENSDKNFSVDGTYTDVVITLDTNAKTFSFTGTAGINDITVDENAPVEYYNIQGVRVANPAQGLFIRRQGSKVEKVYVK